ncbi:hypothetical protein [Paeniroseomonas aquatica]
MPIRSAVADDVEGFARMHADQAELQRAGGGQLAEPVAQHLARGAGEHAVERLSEGRLDAAGQDGVGAGADMGELRPPAAMASRWPCGWMLPGVWIGSWSQSRLESGMGAGPSWVTGRILSAGASKAGCQGA